jgi:hypothetical protein
LKISSIETAQVFLRLPWEREKSDELHPLKCCFIYDLIMCFSAERLNQLADRAEGDGLENGEDGELEDTQKRKGRWKRVRFCFLFISYTVSA